MRAPEARAPDEARWARHIQGRTHALPSDDHGHPPERLRLDALPVFPLLARFPPPVPAVEAPESGANDYETRIADTLLTYASQLPTVLSVPNLKQLLREASVLIVSLRADSNRFGGAEEVTQREENDHA